MKPGMADDGAPGSGEEAGSGADGDGESGADDERVSEAGGRRRSGRTDEAGIEDPVDLVLELIEIRPAEVRCGISLAESGDSNDPGRPDDSNDSDGPDDE